MNKKNKIQTSTSRKVFMICDYALMLLITLICIYPFWYIIIYTFSEGSQVDVNPPVFLPRGFTLSNYKDIFELKGFFSCGSDISIKNSHRNRGFRAVLFFPGISFYKRGNAFPQIPVSFSDSYHVYQRWYDRKLHCYEVLWSSE